MSWRERQLITVLSIILAILSAAVLIVLGIRYREARARAEAAEADPVVQVAEAAKESGSKYVALEYCNGETTLAFDFTEQGKWVWRYDHDFPLDPETVNTILDAVTVLSPQQTLTSPDPLEDYGLDDPDAYLIVTTTEQSYIHLLFGKTTTDGGSYYCLLNGDDATVYIFDGALMELMKVPIYDMCVLPELPVLAEEQLLSIALFGSAGSDGSITRLTELTAQRPDGNRGGSDTSWRCSGANVTGDKAVQAMIEDLENLSIPRCVIYNPSDEAVTMCGFDTPTARITVDYLNEGGEEEHLLLLIGNPLPDGTGRYVRLGEDNTIYFLPTALLDPMVPVAVNGLEP